MKLKGKKSNYIATILNNAKYNATRSSPILLVTIMVLLSSLLLIFLLHYTTVANALTYLIL